MKNRLMLIGLGILSFTTGAAVPVFASNKTTCETRETVVVSYDFHRIPTPGSNQLAIWVENAAGKFIRTLFVTRFTAKGGYTYRPAALKTWVEKSNWKEATESEVDALSSATPDGGSQKVAWDCKDQKGKMVPDGTYAIKMEGNLRDEKKMYAKADITIGAESQKVTAELSYSSEESKSELLFDHVVVDYYSPDEP